ncbi:hypothetical protein POM88_026340 [Heracleum sosnowskyi]|uniref:Uncharacterized protein n=1 Tax=Heracleum sosnowskyi TaxID=360622 RepID=A0AAD8I5S5_9APIA|nr:hypothetical protein POM88_026340 [Heracleum sosnowskyi]
MEEKGGARDFMSRDYSFTKLPFSIKKAKPSRWGDWRPKEEEQRATLMTSEFKIRLERGGRSLNGTILTLPLGMALSAPCGPYDRSLLSFQKQHMSTNIWAGIDRDKLNLRQGTSRLADWDIKEPQKFYIKKWGFGVFYVWELRRSKPPFHKENYIVTLAMYVHEWDLLSHGGADFVSERDYCPIEEYMRWYLFITKPRISPHDIHLPRIIQPRDWCDQLLMVNGVRLHHLWVMVEVEGPGFERPTFPRRAPMEVVEPIVPHVTTGNPSTPVDFNNASPSTTSDPMDFNTIGPIASVPMDSNTTGPSSTSVPTECDIAGPSTSSFKKMPCDYYNDIYEIDTKEDLLVDVRRGGPEMKGDIKRALKSRKARWLYGNWWSKEVEVEIAARSIKGVEVEVISHRNLFYNLDKSHLMTLKPRNEVADEIVNAYFELLREREKRSEDDLKVLKSFLVNEKLVPIMLHIVNKTRFPEIQWRRVKQLVERPMQVELDCGIFVCKYVDAYLMGLSIVAGVASEILISLVVREELLNPDILP